MCCRLGPQLMVPLGGDRRLRGQEKLSHWVHALSGTLGLQPLPGSFPLLLGCFKGYVCVSMRMLEVNFNTSIVILQDAFYLAYLRPSLSYLAGTC